MTTFFTLLSFASLVIIKVWQFRLSDTLFVLLVLGRWYLIEGNSGEGRTASKVSLSDISFEYLLKNLIKCHLLEFTFVCLYNHLFHFVVSVEAVGFCAHFRDIGSLYMLVLAFGLWISNANSLFVSFACQESLSLQDAIL